MQTVSLGSCPYRHSFREVTDLQPQVGARSRVGVDYDVLVQGEALLDTTAVLNQTVMSGQVNNILRGRMVKFAMYVKF